MSSFHRQGSTFSSVKTTVPMSSGCCGSAVDIRWVMSLVENTGSGAGAPSAARANSLEPLRKGCRGAGGPRGQPQGLEGLRAFHPRKGWPQSPEPPLSQLRGQSQWGKRTEQRGRDSPVGEPLSPPRRWQHPKTRRRGERTPGPQRGQGPSPP